MTFRKTNSQKLLRRVITMVSYGLQLIMFLLNDPSVSVTSPLAPDIKQEYIANSGHSTEDVPTSIELPARNGKDEWFNFFNNASTRVFGRLLDLYIFATRYGAHTFKSPNYAGMATFRRSSGEVRLP